MRPLAERAVTPATPEVASAASELPTPALPAAVSVPAAMGLAAPVGAAGVFGGAFGSAVRYAEILATRGVEWGMIGPREVPRIWDRHLLNCAVVAELIDPVRCDSLADIGSGAGLPGVVLAMLLPAIRVTLVEPLERRVRFLETCLGELNLANAEIRRGRAEAFAGKIAADVVTARAVAPLERLAPLAAGLAREGGTVLAIKGGNAEAELARAHPVLRRIGARGAEVLRVGHGKVDPETTVVRFTLATNAARGSGGRASR